MLLNEVFASTKLDRYSIPQRNLDIRERVRTNPFPWIGQFSPQLVEELLAAYAPKSSVVLDPFVGSGTLLGEAVRLGLRAHGCELNPAAVILAKTHQMANLEKDARTLLIENVRDRVFQVINTHRSPLFSTFCENTDRAALENALVALWRDSEPGATQDLAATLIILCDFYRKALDDMTVYKVWQRLENIVRNLPESEEPISVYHSDARNLPIEDNSIDLVLTSPPYINVHNYHQKYRRSVEAMGWNALDYARSEIGSNRQNRANRYLTVIQYSLDMTLALWEMVRASRQGGLLILILGRESLVRGTRFFNGELITEIAVQSLGLPILRRQERVFRNRYGNKIYEDILHFRATEELPEKSFSMHQSRKISGKILSAAREVAPKKEKAGIDDALERLELVNHSPIPEIAQCAR